MAFLHNKNKHSRISFSIGIETTPEFGDRFAVWITRSEFNLKFTNVYYPKTESIHRIQSLIDSGLFRPKIKIEGCYAEDQSGAKTFYDYIDVELI